MVQDTDSQYLRSLIAFPAFSMNYHHMIEPYLYGSLSPEDEVAFERQLSRDPSLSEATGHRLNAKSALAGFSEFEVVPQHRPSSARMLLFVGLIATIIGLFWWKMRPDNQEREGQINPTEIPVIQSRVVSD